MNCLCEHADHFEGQGHPYGGVPAGEQRAKYVGPVCDACAEGHMKNYLN